MEHCQSAIHSKMRKGTVKFQAQSFFFSFEPIFEALIALGSAPTSISASFMYMYDSGPLLLRTGMAFSLAKDRDLSRCGMKCPSH